MRSKLLADRAAGNESDFQKFLEERKEQDGEKKNGFFSNMGKFVAKRWKELVSVMILLCGCNVVVVVVRSSNLPTYLRTHYNADCRRASALHGKGRKGPPALPQGDGRVP